MGAKLKVLIVDGEPLVARALRRELLRDGIEVEFALHDQPPSQLDGAPPPDAVVSSFRMSNGADRDFIPFIDDPAPLAACIIPKPREAAGTAGGIRAACRVMVVAWDSQELGKLLRRQLLGRDSASRARSITRPHLRAV